MFACNAQKFDREKFLISNEYFLHSLQSQRTNLIDFLSYNTAQKLGYSACFSECLFKNARIIRNDAINETAFTELIVSNLKKDWKNTASISASHCLESMSNVKVNNAVRLGNVKKCSILPTLLLQCVLKDIRANCPSNSQISTYVCSRSRSNFNYCDAFASNEYGGTSGRIYNNVRRVYSSRGYSRPKLSTYIIGFAGK
ncbi:uncharacterized protein LOC135946579 [Cloeon dipterum]|uniref:uncharacterized protein LOC135946579 n=1 Tax=Cloeon dipterum TaxID=197152 RepID=UPI0032204DDC